MSVIKQELINFVVDNFMFGNSNGLNDDTSFLDEGIMDSTGAMELVSFLEETYAIEIEDEELIPENLDSINNLHAFMLRKGIQGT